MADTRRDQIGGDMPSLPDKVLAIHEALYTGRVPHAIGGALALAYYAEPRATIDIDLNVFRPAEDWQCVAQILESLGVDTTGLDPTALVRDGQCRLWWGDNPVDLFFSTAPVHEEMHQKTRVVPFAGEMIPVLGPEHLAICKAMFDRPKDWLDIEQMLLATDDLEVSEVERWLTAMVGENDHRVQRLDELKTKLAMDR